MTSRAKPILLLLAIVLASMQGLASPTISIKNFGKVDDNYYRGSQPDAAQFQDLKQLGIKTIIDLRKDRVDEASQWARAAGLQYVNIPLTTKQPATDDQTNQFLKLVNDPANWPVFVHCKGGRHRTGEMTAIFRITHDGWTSDQAYEEMKKYDFEDSFFYPRSLKKYVFSYYEQFTAQTHGRLSRHRLPLRSRNHQSRLSSGTTRHLVLNCSRERSHLLL